MQRGEFEGEDVEAVVQVCAEAAFLDFAGQIAVGAGDDADVDLDRLRGTQRHDFAFLEDAQQLGLQRQRHLGNLVE